MTCEVIDEYKTQLILWEKQEEEDAIWKIKTAIHNKP
jgi:hypothetical protein